MSNLIARIQQEGIPLGGSQRWLPAYFDLERLRHAVPEGKVLVILYGNEALGWSACPDDLSTYRLIRRSPDVQAIECFAVDKMLAGM